MKTKLQITLFLFFLTNLCLFAQTDYALEFNDVNAQRVRYLTTSGDILDTKLNGATDYTIEVWVKPTSTDIHNNVVLKRWNQFAITLYQDENPRFYFTHYSPSTTGTTTFVNTLYNVININQWNHIVIINDGTANTLKLYANGVDVTGDFSGNPTTQTALPLDAAPDASNLYVGYGGSGSYLIGQVDKVRVKNTAESIGNLQTSITDADYTTDANTAILYNFNEGTGLTTINEADSNAGILQCNAGDCVADETWWVDLNTTLSTEKLENVNFKLYPNPAVDSKFIVQTNNNENLLQVEMFDILNKQVNKINFNEKTYFTNVETRNLKSGIYFVKIKTNKGVGIKKIILK